MSYIKTLLLAFALVGLLVPNAALQACQCCTDGEVSEPECEKSCCNSAIFEKSCCSHVTAESCCSENDCCGKCHCSKLPEQAIAVEPVRKFNEAQEQIFASLTLDIENLQNQISAFIATDYDLNLLSGSLRLHSKICVWLN